jgi:hypothetical protein
MLSHPCIKRRQRLSKDRSAPPPLDKGAINKTVVIVGLSWTLPCPGELHLLIEDGPSDPCLGRCRLISPQCHAKDWSYTCCASLPWLRKSHAAYVTKSTYSLLVVRGSTLSVRPELRLWMVCPGPGVASGTPAPSRVNPPSLGWLYGVQVTRSRL